MAAACSEGGRVEVVSDPAGPLTRISVSDDGSGIPAAVLPRIFERFFRADPARSRAEGGTGLGLAIVRHLVHAMGGEVGAESELGRGTSIRFTLPAIGVTPEAPSGAPIDGLSDAPGDAPGD